MYAVTYLVLTWYLLTCNHNYVFSEVKSIGVCINVVFKEELKGIQYHNYVIRMMGISLIGLEVYWFYEAVCACLYVIRAYKREKLQ